MTCGLAEAVSIVKINVARHLKCSIGILPIAPRILLDELVVSDCVSATWASCPCHASVQRHTYFKIITNPSWHVLLRSHFGDRGEVNVLSHI